MSLREKTGDPIVSLSTFKPPAFTMDNAVVVAFLRALLARFFANLPDTSAADGTQHSNARDGLRRDVDDIATMCPRQWREFVDGRAKSFNKMRDGFVRTTVYKMKGMQTHKQITDAVRRWARTYYRFEYGPMAGMELVANDDMMEEEWANVLWMAVMARFVWKHFDAGGTKFWEQFNQFRFPQK